VTLPEIKLPEFGDSSSAKRAFAAAFNKELAEQIKLLLEQKHLYQKVSIEPGSIKASTLKRAYGNLRAPIEQSIGQLLNAPLRPSTTERFATHLSDMRREEVELMLVVLNVRLYCTTCQERSVFEPVFLNDLGNELLGLASRSGREFPLNEFVTKQTFFVALQCQHCKGMPEAVLIRRDGWKFHLDHQCVCVCIAQVREIFFFPFAPWQLLCRVTGHAVGTGFNCIRHPATEQSPDRLQSGESTLVFHCIMEKRGNGLVFVAASIEHQRADGHEVADVRHRSALASLRMM